MRYLIAVFAAVLLCAGCTVEDNPVISNNDVQNGKILIDVSWPDGVAGRVSKVTRDAPDKITAYIYHTGKEVTRADLKHEGTRGISEISVAAQNGYRLELVAFDDAFDQVLYTGMKDNISVIANISNPVSISMFDAAPVLYPAKKTGDNSYILSWSRVPLAVSYNVEENASDKFLSGNLLDDMKLSTTIYSGPDTTKVITGKQPGTYHYLVFPITNYGRSYISSLAGEKNWDFYIGYDYGPISNIVSVQTGATGSMKIDIPWPIR